MKHNLACLLGATALSTMSAAAFADGIDPTVLTEGQVVGQISQLATLSGTTGTGAYAFSPEWSEELGASATGRVGFRLQDNAALGFILTGGERKREVLLNFGLELDATRQIVVTAGQLQEKLEFGTAAEREWVKQNEFGIAYDTSNYGLSVYHVDSETTANFVGAKSTGAELSGSVDVSDAMTVGFGAGYEKLEWDDGAAGVDGLTASVDVGYQANATTRLNMFADHNMSENQFGFGGSWALGAGTLDASYTFIDGRVGAVTDDNRLAVTFTMPLGGNSASEVSRNATRVMSASAAPTSTLLADVMRRPDYLPERVIVKAANASNGSICDTFTANTSLVHYDTETEQFVEGSIVRYSGAFVEGAVVGMISIYIRNSEGYDNMPEADGLSLQGINPYFATFSSFADAQMYLIEYVSFTPGLTDGQEINIELDLGGSTCSIPATAVLIPEVT